jgi:hypothetical protein
MESIAPALLAQVAIKQQNLAIAVIKSSLETQQAAANILTNAVLASARGGSVDLSA